MIELKGGNTKRTNMEWWICDRQRKDKKRFETKKKEEIQMNRWEGLVLELMSRRESDS